MAKKPVITYACTNCGAVSNSWSGRCWQCQEWNTLEEQVSLSPSASQAGHSLKPASLKEALPRDDKRLKTGLADLDEVFGGGLVQGSVNLLAGQPGIGKSTLLLQLANQSAKSSPSLYISGEESAHQLAARAKRLGLNSVGLRLATTQLVEDVTATIAGQQFKLLIVDSIQSISSTAVSSQPGSVSQIVACTSLLSQAAKAANCTLVIVGHVTKEGQIAGPKLLEHMVDVVLQLEGDSSGGFKVIRSSKNRYGSTNETAILEMGEAGLQPVTNPSAALLAEREVSDGSIVLATMEGSRPLLVEVQALVNPTSYGYPKRTSSGFDLNRLNLLVAVLERRTKLRLSDQDVYINIVGGLQIKEPAADLAVAMAIGSAAKGLLLKQNYVVFGEVGLSGEIRHVPMMDKRLKEASKLGFKGAIGPVNRTKIKLPGLDSTPNLRDSLNRFLEKN